MSVHCWLREPRIGHVSTNAFASCPSPAPSSPAPRRLAKTKVNYTFGACVCRAILCNWLVNLAVWIANASQDVVGKAVGIYLPIMCFVAIGAEHVIANQVCVSLCDAMAQAWEV